jgi:hypothetical protein
VPSQSTHVPPTLPILQASHTDNEPASLPLSFPDSTVPTMSLASCPVSPPMDCPAAPTMPVHPMITRACDQIFKPKQMSDGFISYPPLKALTASTMVLSSSEPTSFSSAFKYVEWRKAMNEEFTALMQNGTWTLVSPQPNMNLVGCKWEFKIKRQADGSL